jgi:hypothetical protein
MIDFEQTLRLKVPLGDVPAGDKVTKLTGEKVYTVGDEIIVYGDTKERHRVLEKHDHTYRYLFAENGSISEMLRDKQVIWLTTMEMLRFHCGKQERERSGGHEDLRGVDGDQRVHGVHPRSQRRH